MSTFPPPLARRVSYPLPFPNIRFPSNNRPLSRPASAALEEQWTETRIVSDYSGRTRAPPSVDCSLPSNDCAAWEHMGPYPSILMLQKDEPVVEYHGPRRAGAYVTFLASLSN